MLVYTSAKESGNTLFGDVSLYYYLDLIRQPAVTNYTDETPGGYIEANIGIGPLEASGNEGEVNYGSAKIGPIAVSASEADRAIGNISIGPIWSKGADSSPSFGAISIGPISIFGEETSLVLEVNSGNISIGPISCRLLHRLQMMGI